MNILLIIMAGVLTIWGVALFLQRAPKYGRWFLIRLGLFLAIIALIVLALTGRLHWLLGVAAGLYPLLRRFFPLVLMRLLPFVRWPGSTRQASSGQQSEVTTQVLKMTLQHDSGDMDGEVLEGPFAGARLSALTIQQLSEIHEYCQSCDAESLRLLESYLHRYHEEAWQQQYQYQQQSSAANGSTMTVNEALEILELDESATEADINRAHKRMMAKFHPDRGGSHYMAVKINQAKDLLLSRL